MVSRMPQTGAPQDFASVYDRYFARVYGFVRSQVGDPAAADDVVSRIFERVLERLASFDPARGAFESWLFAVARNAVRDHFRSRRQPLWDGAGDDPPSREPAMDERLVAAEERHRLLLVLRSLDERSREVLGLKFQAGLNNRQIAEVLDLGESHVGVLVYRAVKKLQAGLGGLP
ncbi:MAG: sigma-70 family RNA polymerase sigma factor [Elusimicrobia bacterium]|nr:sigma-70 family RNA polymerase sigma factor [Elusimicrobiota bacterium]